MVKSELFEIYIYEAHFMINHVFHVPTVMVYRLGKYYIFVVSSNQINELRSVGCECLGKMNPVETNPPALYLPTIKIRYTNTSSRSGVMKIGKGYIPCEGLFLYEGCAIPQKCSIVFRNIGFADKVFSDKHWNSALEGGAWFPWHSNSVSE